MFYKSIIDCVQEEVDRICDNKWEIDQCKPKFLVSLNSEYTDKLILTITHMGQSFSETLFPRLDMPYGYESVEYMMRQMYNRTM